MLALLGFDDALEEARPRLARPLREQRVELLLRAVVLLAADERRRFLQRRRVLLARLLGELAVVLRERGHARQREDEQDQRREASSDACVRRVERKGDRAF